MSGVAASSRVRIVLGLLAVGLAASGLWGARGVAERGGGAVVSPDAGRGDVLTDDEARARYVEANLEVLGVEVGADKRPDGDGGVGTVGGLLRVSGVVRNKGDLAIRSAKLTIFLKDAEGKVIGTYLNDVVGRDRLDPGETRPFQFTVPEKKEYGGSFSYELH